MLVFDKDTCILQNECNIKSVYDKLRFRAGHYNIIKVTCSQYVAAQCKSI